MLSPPFSTAPSSCCLFPHTFTSGIIFLLSFIFRFRTILVSCLICMLEVQAGLFKLSESFPFPCFSWRFTACLTGPASSEPKRLATCLHISGDGVIQTVGSGCRRHSSDLCIQNPPNSPIRSSIGRLPVSAFYFLHPCLAHRIFLQVPYLHSFNYLFFFFSFLSEGTVAYILYKCTSLVSFVPTGNMMIRNSRGLLNKSSNTFVMTVLFVLALYHVFFM